jgi:hypothetical protein
MLSFSYCISGLSFTLFYGLEWHLIAANMSTTESKEIWQLHSLKLLMHGGAFHAGMSLPLR